MPKEITISVPEEVADRLEQESDVSLYISKAILSQMRLEPMRRKVDPRVMQEVHDRIESNFTDEERAQVRRELDEAAAKMTPELREWARQLLAEHAPHRLHQLPQV